MQKYKNYFNLPNNVTTKCNLTENCKAEITIYTFLLFYLVIWNKNVFYNIPNKTNKKIAPTFVSAIQLLVHLFYALIG